MVMGLYLLWSVGGGGAGRIEESRAYPRKYGAVAHETRRLSDCEQTMGAQPYRATEDKQQANPWSWRECG